MSSSPGTRRLSRDGTLNEWDFIEIVQGRNHFLWSSLEVFPWTRKESESRARKRKKWNREYTSRYNPDYTELHRNCACEKHFLWSSGAFALPADLFSSPGHIDQYEIGDLRQINIIQNLDQIIAVYKIFFRLSKDLESIPRKVSLLFEDLTCNKN